MKKLHFESTEQFVTLFQSKRKDVTDSIVESIEQAMSNCKKTALLFEITFEDAELMYEISLPASQWPSALEKCLEHYHELGLSNEQIDTWKLLEAAKVW
jgi:hypothetical protein